MTTTFFEKYRNPNSQQIPLKIHRSLMPSHAELFRHGDQTIALLDAHIASRKAQYTEASAPELAAAESEYTSTTAACL